MRMVSARRAQMFDPAEMRLPLIALIDVILFLLMYFLLAGSLESEERELAAALAAERASAAAASALAPQIVDVVRVGDAEVFRLGARVVETRRDLADLIRALPVEPGIVIRGDDSASVAGVAAATQAAEDAGFTRITYQPRRRTAGEGQ